MSKHYPQSSCECYKCTEKKFPENIGHPTNMSVRGCNFPEFYECYNRNIFKINIEPSKEELPNNIKNNYKIYNPNIFKNSSAPDFGKYTIYENGKPREVAMSMDPRLVSAWRGLRYPLDQAPIDETVQLKNIYSKDLNEYGKRYKDYSDINAGDITYYNNKSIEDAFFKPVFGEQAQTIGIMYKDPMGAMKPEYKRIPLKATDPLTQNTCNYKPYCLSSIQDSQTFRESIMASQMAQQNQTKYTARWSNIKNKDGKISSPYMCCQ
jgi:hypothetical protein